MSFLLVNLRASFFRLGEAARIVCRYYRNGKFLFTDFLLAIQYLFKNPYRVSKQFLKKKGERNLFVYGETPLTTLDKICRECRILSKDTVYELGCGAGRSSFWLSHFVGCKVVGLDLIPAFIRRANRVKKLSSNVKVSFLKEDFILADYRKATCLYLYGTCLDDETIYKLIENFEKLSTGTKVITVSYPLTDFRPDLFRLEKFFEANFPWGRSEVYLNVKL